MSIINILKFVGPLVLVWALYSAASNHIKVLKAESYTAGKTAGITSERARLKGEIESENRRNEALTKLLDGTLAELSDKLDKKEQIRNIHTIEKLNDVNVKIDNLPVQTRECKVTPEIVESRNSIREQGPKKLEDKFETTKEPVNETQ